MFYIFKNLIQHRSDIWVIQKILRRKRNRVPKLNITLPFSSFGAYQKFFCRYCASESQFFSNQRDDLGNSIFTDKSELLNPITARIQDNEKHTNLTSQIQYDIQAVNLCHLSKKGELDPVSTPLLPSILEPVPSDHAQSMNVQKPDVARVIGIAPSSGHSPCSESLDETLASPQTFSTPLPIDRKPLIAIVGRPNVGKSTFFNRLLKKNESLVTNISGTTRDRKYGSIVWDDYPVLLVDTGGLFGSDQWSESIHAQALIATEEADIIIVIVDYESGLTKKDEQLAKMLRKMSSKPIFVAINKCDNPKRISDEANNVFTRLGFGTPFPISATHNIGVYDLIDAILSSIAHLGFQRTIPDEPESEHALSKDGLITTTAYHSDGRRKEIRVAIVGVPNVGKSSFLNRVLGFERSIVSPIPYTTTAPIDERILWKNTYPITIVDTAGITKKKSQCTDLERLSVLHSLRSIENSHVSILLLDARLGPKMQDARISRYILENYRSCLVVVNKWDLSSDTSIHGMQVYEEQLRDSLKFWNFIPIVFASAAANFNIETVMNWAVKIANDRLVKLATRKLFQAIEEASLIRPLPADGKKSLRIRFCTQANLHGGPTFVFFVNHPELASASYSKFLENFIRQHYAAFSGTPIRMLFRKNESRCDDKDTSAKHSTSCHIKKKTRKR